MSSSPHADHDDWGMVGQYDSQIDSARTRLAAAEVEYREASVQMADAPANVRQFVLDEIQGRIDESKWMIDTFTSVNEG